MKKILSLMLAVVFCFQIFCTGVSAGNVLQYSPYDLINKCNMWVHYGSRSYAQYYSEVDTVAVKCQVDAAAAPDENAIIDFNLTDNPVDLSLYRYMVIQYYRKDDYSNVRVKNFFTDGTSETYMEYGKSNEWYSIVLDLGENNAQKQLKQIHVIMYPDMSNGVLLETEATEPYIYIKNMIFYENDPRTAEQKAEAEALRAEAESMRGSVQEYGVFEKLEVLEKTDDLLQNPNMETLDNWQGSNSVPELCPDAYDGENCIKITNRDQTETLYYSGVRQNVTDVFKTYGSGYYKFGAYIRCDENSPIEKKNYDIRIGINKYTDAEKTKKAWTYYYSGYSICDEWQKSENVAYIPWDENCISAFFIIYGGDTSEKVHSDFYVDKCTFKKYIEADREETHKAYIFPDSDGRFYPEAELTEKDFRSMLELCTETTVSGLDTDNAVSGSTFMSYITECFDYSANTDYSEKKSVKRAEAVSLINAAQGRVPDKTAYLYTNVISFTDVDASYWAYDDITEAATEHYAYISGINNKEAWQITEQSYDFEMADKRGKEIFSQIQARKQIILNASDNLDIKGTTYYFSNNGDDNNSGTSPEEPFSSMEKLAALELSAGDGVLFERGSIWRGAIISCVSDVTYGAYGTGEKPAFYGSAKDYADPALWQQTDVENIWETTDEIKGSVGFVSFNNGDKFALKKFSEDELTQEYTFYDGRFADSKIKIYSVGNPGQIYENIEIAPGASVINAVKKQNCVVDNLSVMYTGWHGFRLSDVNNITITNCEVGYIGGTGENSRWGNGIEVWNTSDNVTIKNNYVYQVYDTGLTNQYSGVSGSPSVQSNIIYEGNVVENSTYGFEFFSSQINSNMDIMKNITVRDNIVAYTGCGWGQENRSVKDTSAAIKGWRSKNRSENFVIEDNVFYKSALADLDWSCFAYNLEQKKLVMTNTTPQYLPELRGNVFAGVYGKYFGEFDYKAYDFDYELNRNMVKDIDENAEIIFLTETDADSEFYVSEPVIAVENDEVAEGNVIAAVCSISSNTTDTDKRLNLILCLYDGIKERAIDVCEYTHVTGADSTLISAQIKIPQGLYVNYEIRAYVLDDDMKKYTDTFILK